MLPLLTLEDFRCGKEKPVVRDPRQGDTVV
jgi:hypothetical protein